MTSFAEIIRKAARGRTAYRLGHDAGLDVAQVSRFLKGERSLTLDAADRLCRVLGLELRKKRKGR